LSSVDEQAPETSETTEPSDEAREEQLEAFRRDLGDAVVEHHLIPGDELWVRVASEAWLTTAQIARRRLGYSYFCYLSAIDWLPSPFGRYEDAEVDTPLADKLAQPGEIATGHAGGDTRFQVMARVIDVRTHAAVMLKADVPDDDLTVDSWSTVYAGADWHERETWEMFGITFRGHPNLIHLYLPSAFEGFPLRKDFPLLARVVKPWPGIVDVEPMPAGEDEDEAAESESGQVAPE
jgi:NADH-quinone oxidoreductase subunit C